MNSFLKTFLAAMLAILVTGVMFVIFTVNVISSVAALMGERSVSVIQSGSILEIELNQPIQDEPSGTWLSDMDFLSMKMNRKLALLEVIDAIDRAAVDNRIAGIYMDVSTYNYMGIATLSELRNALQRFKMSGKFIYSYADLYTQQAYYLSSVADKIYLNPQGEVTWKGLSSQVMFYKGLLDKLDLKPEVFRYGDYKSAVEPLLMEKMSPENRFQTEILTETIWGQIVSEIAASRSIDSVQLQAYASELTLSDGFAALRTGMVDSLAYRGDVEAILGEMTDQEEGPNFVSLGEYIAQSKMSGVRSSSQNEIAVVYAEGEIVLGDGGQDLVGGDALVDKLNEMRQNESVKAVVLRINSPGGSALAAEGVWHAMELLRAEKPVIVSMGDVAASGGYYMAVPADVILASPGTLTGSIGVFSVLLDASQGLKDKLGITVDGVNTNPSADIGSPFRKITPAERDYFQQGVNRVYAVFVDHVSRGRNLRVTQVADSLAGGRVWSGVSALQNGLIDAYGGLREAILLAADRAGVADDYQVTTPSVPSDRLSRILGLLNSKVQGPAFEGELGEIFQQYSRLQRILEQRGVQALMPVDIRIE